MFDNAGADNLLCCEEHGTPDEVRTFYYSTIYKHYTPDGVEPLCHCQLMLSLFELFAATISEVKR
jgi:hypothetical protein